MGLLSWFGFRRGDYANGNPGQAAALAPDYGSTRSIPGVTIDADSAITISAVFRSVHLISSTIASFPVDVLEKQPDGSRVTKEYLIDRPIWDKPNHEQTRVEFLSIAMGHMLLNGNTFIFVKPEDGPSYSFWAIEPERVDVARQENGQKAYRVDGRDKIYFDFLDGGNIIHIAGWGRDGLVGVSPVRLMITTLGLAKATEEYAARYFGAGTTLGGILSTEQELKPDEAKDFKQRWDSAHTGVANAHQVAVLSKGLKWQSASTSPEDSQMTDVRQFQVAEIARIFGVPEHLIGSHDKTSSWGQGLEINNRAFLQFCLMPHLLRIEQALNDNFLAAVNDDLRYRRYVKFNSNSLLRGTSSERAAFYTSMFNLGVYSTNDIAALEDMPNIGAEGDLRFVPGNNLVPLERILDELTAPPVETPV